MISQPSHMKKILIPILLLVAFTTAASAQNKPAASFLSFAVQGALPVNNSQYNSGIGASAQFEIPAAASLNFTVGVGYTSFTLKDNYKKLLAISGNSTSSQGFVPVQVGVKYYILPQFYSAIKVGAAVSTQSNASTVFTYSPGIGGEIPVGKGNSIDVGVRYEGWSTDGTLSFIGLHAGYKFGL